MCGDWKSWTRRLNIDPLRHCQREDGTEAGAGGACFSGGRASKQNSGHETTGCLDEVGTGDGAERYLAGHLEVEPPEDQVLDSGGPRCPPQCIQPVHLGAK